MIIKQIDILIILEIQKDIMSKIEGRLDNACPPEIFKFSFECKEYKVIETTNKNNPFT